MKFSLARIAVISTLGAALSISSAFAQDPSINKLLSKLPPPEQVIKTDPAFRDPLRTQIASAIKAQNFGQAMELLRKLAQRYPKSAGAQASLGLLAFQLHRLDEAGTHFAGQSRFNQISPLDILD